MMKLFSPVVRFFSIRLLLSFAVQNGLLIHQMDVETAFLNVKPDEEIYTQQPEGYVKPGEEHLVCRLDKSLYELEQSSRCWNKAFRDSGMCSEGWFHSSLGRSLCVHQKGGHVNNHRSSR